ncbi:MAG: hypothetical protein KF847_01000 [Pirellulales bacterium]|nr:hypothetical protein [Pirellulales bacterium]
MAILIGVDEAGYGPNLGPLVVAASAWQIEYNRAEVGGRRSREESAGAATADAAERAGAALRGQLAPRVAVDSRRESTTLGAAAALDLYALLAEGVTRAPARRAAGCGAGVEPIAIADSKALYKPGTGLRLLERGVLAAWATLSEGCRRFSERIDHAGEAPTALIDFLGADPAHARRRLPWHAAGETALPTACSAGDVAAAAGLLDATCRAAGVRLAALRARIVHPAEFNALCAEHGTKGAALSHVTLALVREAVDATDGGEIFITCDKHGGRNRYAALVQSHFSESWIEIHGESRSASRYAWSHRDASCTATFRVGGEAELPAALASMTAKYLRELAMHEFNAWWRERVQGLKPTAGYPVDAKRFKREISAVQQRLGIADRDLWRDR